jgi:hypothetical protein
MVAKQYTLTMPIELKTEGTNKASKKRMRQFFEKINNSLKPSFS